LLIGLICISMIKFGPWMYVSYNPSGSEKTVDISYYSNFRASNTSLNNSVEDFFSENSSNYLGVDKGDFYDIPKFLSYISYCLIGLGLFFSIFVIVDRKIRISIEKLLVFQTIYTVLIVPILLYAIYILSRFIGAQFLLANNSFFINKILPNSYIVFTTPIILIFFISFLLYILFIVIKSNYKEIYGLNKDLSSLKIKSYEGGNQN